MNRFYVTIFVLAQVLAAPIAASSEEIQNLPTPTAATAPVTDTLLSPVEATSPVVTQDGGADGSNAGGVPTQCRPPSATYSLCGDQVAYEPFLTTAFDGMTLRAPLMASLRYESTSRFAVDRYGTTYEPDPAVVTGLRVGLDFNSHKDMLPVLLKAEFEYDFFTGAISGDEIDIEGEAYPNSEGYEASEIRKLYLRASFGNYLTVAAGHFTNHWGLGLVANDGSHRPQPGTADFADPRGGDRVAGAYLATGPWTGAELTAVTGYYAVVGDDVLLEDDKASQAVAALTLLTGDPTEYGRYKTGLYAAWRTQEADDGDITNITVIDHYLSVDYDFADSLRFDLQTEFVYIFGQTDLAPTHEYEQHDIAQAGLAVRAGLNGKRAGGVIDFVYASGDQNYDDDSSNNFKADPNYEFGMLLFRNIIAAQTARSTATASDLELVGRPNEDLNRIPTRGSVTNTMAFFPRGWLRIIDGLEAYGGPIFAFSEVAYTDPFSTRLNGGEPTNPLGEKPGSYYGTEYNIGLRFRSLVCGSQLTAGLEAAYFSPGSGLRGSGDAKMSSVSGMRTMLTYEF
jgi:hypothetical protein